MAFDNKRWVSATASFATFHINTELFFTFRKPRTHNNTRSQQSKDRLQASSEDTLQDTRRKSPILSNSQNHIHQYHPHTTVKMGAVISCIESVFAAIGSCIMACVNAIASVIKAIINVCSPWYNEQRGYHRAAIPAFARGILG